MKEKYRRRTLNNMYLVFLIFVLILAFLISFKTGENLYYLINTNSEEKDTITSSSIADWSFDVRIEY